MWDKTSNLKAYDNIEKNSNYKNPQELIRYRNHLLQKSQVQAEFIKGYCDKKLKVFEACSGNSRLLYQLHMDLILEEGTGIEISRSRTDFAEEWKKEFPGVKVSNICQNLIECQVPDEYYDLAVCITGAFGYFYPIDTSYPDLLLNKFNKLLKSDGCLLLELYQHVNTIEFCKMNNKHEYNNWVELPESDPFRYYLSKYTFFVLERCLESKEIFIKRDGYIDDTKKEVLKVYSLREVNIMLEQNGFKLEGAYSEWDKKEYNDQSEKLIIMARKIS